jgi:AcrR family transcriptional regulator
MATRTVSRPAQPRLREAAPTAPTAPTAPAVPERLPVRERLLAAADELFYREGINNVGIDRVLEHAGVAKASLYATFGSKEELVRAYLEGRQETRRASIEAYIARHRSPREQLLAVFDALVDTCGRPTFRGCAFVMARSELPAGERTQPVLLSYRHWVRELFVRLARDAGARNAPVLAQQLLLLYDGALMAAQMDGNGAAAVTARSTAALLLDAAAAPKR